MRLRGVVAPVLLALALSPGLAWGDGIDGLALDGGGDEDGGRGRFTIGFQSVHTDGNVDGSGNALPGARTDTRNLLFAVDYRIAGRWWLHASIPFVDKRALDDPGVHNTRFLASPRDSAFIDDGDWHGAWQDWQLGLSHHGHWKGLKVQPHAVLTWPSHDYVFFASAAPGRRLHKLRLGVDVGRRFGRGNVHWSLGYSYEFVEKVLDYDLDKHHYRASLRWDVSPTWSLSAFATGRYSQGIRPSDLAGRVPWSELWYQHDRLLRHNYVLAGTGASWRVNDDWSLSASAAWPVQSDSMHRIRNAYELQRSEAA